MERRLGVPIRPLPFFSGGLLLILGLAFGLNWQWTVQQFSGAVLAQILFPGGLFAAGGWKFLALIGALGGLALLLLFSFAPGAGRFGSRMRFYPTIFLLALFLIVYGCIFFFDVTVQADDTPIGYALFINLNYAYLTSRIGAVIIGFVVLLIGWALLLFGSFGFENHPRPRRAGTVAPPAEPRPQPSPSPRPVAVLRPKAR